jgi:hypothetical protein
MKSYLEDTYDLYCYNTKSSKHDNNVKLVAMMGSNLMIVMFENNEIQNQEINTARILKIPILFIFNSEEDKQRDSVNQGENRIVFKSLERIELVLKYRFKLIKKFKFRKYLPFETLENKTKLFEFNIINSISILKDKKKLILVGDKIQSYDLHENTLKDIIKNNKDKEIIILNNRVFSKYNFDFIKISEDKIFELDSNVIINEIDVNEKNKHIYGISNNRMKLYRFNEEFKLKQIMDITVPLLIKVLNNNLYTLLKGYGNSKNMEGSYTSKIIENEKSIIHIYSQKEYEVIKFKRKMIIDVLVLPDDFHVDENFFFIFTPFINKHHIFDHKSHVFVFDHDGMLLQKTGKDIWGHQDTRFLLVDYQTIFCADFKYDSNYFLC